MTTPIETLLGWVEGLDRETREELSFLVSAMVPLELVKGESEPRQDPNAESKRLRERAERWSAGMPSQNVGTTLMLAGCFDFFLAKRGTSQDWAEVEAMFNEIIDSALKMPDKIPPSVVEHAKRSLADLPRRSSMWIAVSDSWKACRQGDLSNAALSDWMRKQKS